MIVFSSLTGPGQTNADTKVIYSDDRFTDQGILPASSTTLVSLGINKGDLYIKTRHRKFVEVGDESSDILKFDRATYTASEPVDVVDINLKSEVWRRITGKQDNTDNGYKYRALIFKIKIRQKGDVDWHLLPYAGMIKDRRATGRFDYLRFMFDKKEQVEIQLDPMANLHHEEDGWTGTLVLDGRQPPQSFNYELRTTN